MRLYRIGFHELLNCFITEICSWQFCSKKLQAGPSVTPFMKKKKRSKKVDHPPPEISLSAKTMKTLETLMLEGDLLEVTMDETNHIWRILQATEPRRSKKFPGTLK